MIEIISALIVVVVIGIPVARNLLGPLLIWRTQKIHAIVQVVLESDYGKVKNQESFFKSEISQLYEMGFTFCHWAKLNLDNNEAHAGVFLHEELSVFAVLNTISTPSSKISYAEFFQEYKNQPGLSVSNSSVVSCYPNTGAVEVFYFPRLQHLPALFETHAEISKRFRSQSDLPSCDCTSSIERISKSFRRESDALMSMNICHEKIDDEGDRKLTLKGAYVLTFRSINPGLWFWKRNRLRKSQVAAFGNGE